MSERIDWVIEITSFQASYANGVVTALCEDWTIWQKDVWPSNEWVCINTKK